MNNIIKTGASYEKDFLAVVSAADGGGFLPSLKVIHPQTPEMETDDKDEWKLENGDIYFPDVGNYKTRMVVQVGPRRDHALWVKPGGAGTLNSYDHTDSTFAIIAQAKANKEKGQLGIGFDFLLWDFESGRFCLIFVKNSAVKRNAPKFIQSEGKTMILTGEKRQIQGPPKMTWWIPKLLDFEGETPEEYKVPSKEQMDEALKQMNNVTQEATPEEQTGRAR